MKASKFNILIDRPGTGESVLYNTLYGSLTTWSQDEVAIVRSLLENPDQDSPIKAMLVDQKNLVDDIVDEMAVVENRKTLGVKDRNRLDVIIMPTLECNFACTYCYEAHRPSRMTNETEAGIKTWLATELPRHKVTLLHWFGGEPLLGYRRVISISRYAVEVACAAGVSCVLHMTTNGYLLNKVRISEMIGTGIRDYQITLDGPRDLHDRFRVLRSGKGTFDRVFQNIIDLVHADDRVKVSLRVNFNHSNLHAIPALLELFPLDTRSQLRVVYEPIFGNCSLGAIDNLPATEISEALGEYYSLAKGMGYDVVLGSSIAHVGKLVYCYAERENQYVLGYNGDVFKCSVSRFEPEDRVGYLRSDGVLVKERSWTRWVSSCLFEQTCYACVYLPLCMGGCRRMRLEHKGSGSCCFLIPAHTSYCLKQLALGGLASLIDEFAGLRV